MASPLIMDRHGIRRVPCPYGILVFRQSILQSSANVETAALTLQPVNYKCGVTTGKRVDRKTHIGEHIHKSGGLNYVATMIAIATSVGPF